MKSDRIFFPGLNILRFYASLAVIYQHIAEASSIPGLSRFPNLFHWLDYVFPAGRHSVTLFFVISGFLITYLLLVEQQRTQTVDIGKFYVRRALRIWPLYYAMTLFACFIMPLLVGFNQNVVSHEGFIVSPTAPDFWTKVVLYLLMLPNMAYAIWPASLPVAHLWSIGVEEQFYLIWPWLLRKFVRHLGWLIYIVIVAKLFLTALTVYAIRLPGDHGDAVLGPLYNFLRDWRIDSMAVGAYGAYILFLQKAWLYKIVFHPVVKYGCAVLFIVHIVFYDTWLPAPHFLLSILYLLLILNIAANPKPLFRLENRVTAFLGNISYGIYVYHFLIILLILHAFKAIGYTANADPLVFNLVLYGLVVGLTLLIAGLSYRYFEMPFLRLKQRFAQVQSTTVTPAPDETEQIDRNAAEVAVQPPA